MFLIHIPLSLQLTDRTDDVISKRKARNPSVASGAATEEESDTDSVVRRSVRTKRPTVAQSTSRGGSTRAAKRDKLEKVVEIADSPQAEDKVSTAEVTEVTTDAPGPKRITKSSRRAPPKRRWETGLVGSSTTDKASSDEDETPKIAASTSKQPQKTEDSPKPGTEKPIRGMIFNFNLFTETFFS